MLSVAENSLWYENVGVRRMPYVATRQQNAPFENVEAIPSALQPCSTFRDGSILTSTCIKSTKYKR